MKAGKTKLNSIILPRIERSLGDHDNVAIWMPELTDKEIEEIKKTYLVTKTFFGYVEFRRKDTK
jgi:hypothetical protein